jgi:protein ImuB
VRALRTLALLGLEYHPPPAAIDRVTVTIEPTPGRVLQHTLFARPHPSPEQIATLLARLGALMGQDRIGAPGRVDSHRPGAFEMQAFAADHTAAASRVECGGHAAITAAGTRPADRVMSALRRCRQPVPARVLVDDRSRPVRITTDHRGAAGGHVVSSAGPWRTSGDWWSTGSWNCDEWDVALDDGSVYRVFRDRDRERWFIDGMVD